MTIEAIWSQVNRARRFSLPRVSITMVVRMGGRAKTPCADTVAPRASPCADTVAPMLALRMPGKGAEGEGREKLLGEGSWKGYTEGCEFPGNLPGHPAYCGR